ncbi:hypothetical protein [Epilithonimonas hungarica]|uniref:Uncharacterized protein n=1 Tax=Epilithonimonas hungarica TaxID=454006 RepID=A0A1G7HWW2_9FLAO|nr:hypothetical protein [Epilithonimonas hungarica]SDF04828.1 hypothetical protein SAMN05421825_0921 [Epilithonimonas hungarica]
MTYPKTISSNSGFPKSFWKTLLLLFFIFSVQALYAQTVITGMEYITISDGAVISIQNEKQSDNNHTADVKCSIENETIQSKKSYIKEKIVKTLIKRTESSEDKVQKTYNDSNRQEIKINSSPYDNDTSFSVSSGRSFLACNVDFHWRAAGMAEKAYFMLLFVWGTSPIFRPHGISFPDHASSYHQGRAPPCC